MQTKPSVVYLLKQVVLGVIVGVAIVAMLALFSSLLEFFRQLSSLEFFGVSFGLYASLLLGFLVAFVVAVELTTSGKPGSGTHYMLESLHLKDGRMALRDTLFKPVASILTIASGGSAGLEGPSLVLGGGIGYKLHNLLGTEAKTAMLAGAAAGLSAVFRAPLTGITFALEIPFKRDIYAGVYLEAGIASVTAYMLSNTLLRGERIFTVTAAAPSGVSISVVGIALAIGILMAAVSVLYVYLYERAEELLHIALTEPGLAIFVPLMGATLVYSVGVVAPEALGVGYDFMSEIYSGAVEATVPVLVAIFVAKLAATIATFAFGGSGGLFIPAIFMGSTLGYAVGLGLGVDPRITAILGASALLAGSHKVLLSPVIFIAETVGPGQIIPALIAASTSYFFSGGHSLMSPQPMIRIEEAEVALERIVYTLPPEMRKIAKRIKIRSIMIPDPVRLTTTMTVSEAVELYARNPFRMLPVVDPDDRLVGVTTLEHLLAVEEEEGMKRLNEIELEAPLTASPNDSVIEVAERMIEEGIDHVYIVNERGRLVGVITGVDIVRMFLKLLPLHEVARPRRRYPYLT